MHTILRSNQRSFAFTIAIVSFFVFASYGSGLNASAQTKSQALTISGVVVDQHGDPVSAAVVTCSVASLSLPAVTDSEGHFSFKEIPAGSAVLTIKAHSFTDLERKIDPGREVVTDLRIVLSPASLSAQVTISATRTETRLGETASSVVLVNANDLKTTAALSLDDALRQVAGFSLFRRSGSRTANPTSQGVSLRGLGASGASRALVLADGVPLNDPFGGWVYWDRVPRESISQVEVLLGSASHLYGSTALGGVIDVATKRPEANVFSLAASYGNEMTPNVSTFLSGEKRGWAASLAAETFRTDGYVLVPENQRGLIDTPAASRDAVLNLRLEKRFSNSGRLFGTTSFFGESRKNGTPLQTNRTHIRQFVFGGDWESKHAGAITAHAYGATQLLDQNFTAISATRNSESLTRVQRVPVQVVGGSAQWSRTVGQRQTLVAGLEAREVRGASDELAFINGRASSYVDSGGREHTVGIYLEDLIRIGSRLFLNVGGRFDHWRNFAALSATRPITVANATNVTVFPDRVESAFSPQLSAVYQLNSRISLVGSISRAFRAPTLNELYRSFRVGNVQTLANEKLIAERLTGGEAGIRVAAIDDKVTLRGTFFWNQINRPVANVTLQSTPSLITRQRQNLGQTRSNGLEVETDTRPNKYWTLSAGYILADATVVKFPANTSLEGLQIPQVPRQQFTFQVRYANPSVVTMGLQGRAASSQFDDDQNLFRLNPYVNLDAFVSRRLTNRMEIFCAIENVFNQRYEVGKTPVTTLGPPLLVRGGFRLMLGQK